MPILLGDCLDVLKRMESNSIDLIYLDPPFFTQKNHSLKTRNNDEEFLFGDIWDTLNDYLDFMRFRLVECHRVLKSTGSIYLHCDKNASHYLRILLDEVFGIDNFRNEIIWAYKRWTNSKKSLQCFHQSIYFYSKSDEYTFNTIYTEYSASTNIDQILQERIKNEHGKSTYKTNDDGDIVFGKCKKGVPLGDIWNIPYLNPKANERVGYPTQKPVLLLERIIEVSSNQGDIILDPFCGSGTALVAAHLLNREYVGIDISEDAVGISTRRLANPMKTTSYLLEKGEQTYINKTEYEQNILRSLDAVPVQRNAGIDGFLKRTYRGKMIPVKIQKDNETLIEARKKLIAASRKRDCEFLVLVKTRNNIDGQVSFERFRAESDNIYVLESFDLSVNKWLDGLDDLYQIALST